MNPQLAGIDTIPGTYVFDVRTSNRALRLNRFLWEMIREDKRAAYQADPEATMAAAQLSGAEMELVRSLNWIGLVQHGANFFVVEKFARVARKSNLEVYASMRGETLAEFMKTRQVPGLR